MFEYPEPPLVLLLHPTKLGDAFVDWLCPIKIRRNSVPRRRPTLETLESLQATLRKLEETDSPGQDPKSISELKRVLLNRIADLELAQILETTDAETDKAPAPAELVPPPSTLEEAPLDGSSRDPDLEKLD